MEKSQVLSPETEGWAANNKTLEGLPMGLLEKRNPRATRRSVVFWATGLGIAGGIFGFVRWLQTAMPTWTVFIIVPWMIVGGAIGGAAMEWQMPMNDGQDDQA